MAVAVARTLDVVVVTGKEVVGEVLDKVATGVEEIGFDGARRI